MPNLNANLTMLFGEVPFLERFRAAADAGFRGVEFLFPYDYDARQLKARLAEHRLEMVLFNLPAGDWPAGERGIACVPDRVAEFETGVQKAIEYARTLGCVRINCLVGLRPDGVSIEAARATVIRNLRFAAPRLAAAGIRLLVEAVNTRDIPGFFLSRTADVLDVIDAAAVDNVFVQHDVYHMQIMEGDLAPTIERILPRLAHVQIADTPGRHEPGTGEINYSFLLPFLDRIGYTGWVGCEYKPAGDTRAGLAWAVPYLSGSAGLV